MTAARVLAARRRYERALARELEIVGRLNDRSSKTAIARAEAAVDATNRALQSLERERARGDQ